MIACAWCGKFIPYADIEDGTAKHTYTPDSSFTVEYIEHICKKCSRKANWSTLEDC